MPRPRLHTSSIFIGTVIAVLLVLIEIPGRVSGGYGGIYPSMVFEHGWPWVYLRRETVERPVPFATPEGLSIVPNVDYAVVSPRDAQWSLPKWGIPWLSAANWRFWQADTESETPRWDFNGAIMSCDIATAVIVATVIVGAWEFRRRRRIRLLSFRLVDVFAALTVVCAVLGWLVHQTSEFQCESQLEAARVAGNDDFWFVYDEICTAPVWVQSLLGGRLLPNFLWRPSNVVLDPALVENASDLSSDLSKLAHLSRIELTVFDPTPSKKPFKFSVLRAITRLETLDVCEYGDINEQDVNELAQLSSLKKLVLWKDEIPPHILSRLEAELPDCRIVDFYDDW